MTDTPMTEAAAMTVTPEPQRRSNEEAERFAVDAARVAAQTRAENVVVLDVRGLCSFADYFVIATGSSDRQMRAVLHHIREHARSIDRKPFRTAEADSTWMLADYVDVVIHLFDPRHRGYYDLDGLWGDGRPVAWEPPGAN